MKKAFGNRTLSKDLFKVALCQLHWKNYEDIQLLTQRGQALNSKEIEEIKKLNKKVQEKIDEYENSEEFVTIDFAFVTFYD